ncbi:molybdopterin guanine dinucleotide-containing S/N-oxide reductase [Bradyrhizobium sp. ARR65]|uniref:molybdopterin guanine dinucleotide-containing S/N-oxide reductase n=1 Tax=Bradyrhizobium sp. ARR65 TaxID=1040989 RepID=UPI0004643472|nr:molybdopterin guanine dinucleotide-containing S/N-oxide reductase [Bradyrhizobium sp. ARR65]
MNKAAAIWNPHSAHWGAFSARWNGTTLEVAPYERDPAPSPMLGNFTTALRHKARILRPMVRKSWLDGNARGKRDFNGGFVEQSWEEVIDLLAAELARVRSEYGASAVYGGSYGWASAGRFHHAQSQVHRFLNLAFGGYVRSVNSYSAGASAVILPHVMGPFEGISRRNVTWQQVAEHTDTVLAFGGMPLKNSTVASGGISAHIERDAMRQAARRGATFFCISPLRDDMPEEASAKWLPIKVGTDVALMLALAHTLLVEDLWDHAFVARYCTGFEKFKTYLLGQDDGTRKDAAWAAEITGLSAGTIVDLARRLPRGRTLVAISHSLQRAQFGEQPVWMGAVLAAMLGQIGLPGGGYNYALGAMGHTGRRVNAVPIPTMPQGKNNVTEFIPVARISDMLLNPGQPFEYNGKSLRYPDIKLVYWAGGNPFHHHQDINRLRHAFNVPDTIVVHDSAWTPMAKFADIVLPATMTLERDDIGAAATDPRLVAMRKVVEPIGEARDDFAIFADLARKLSIEQAFTEGRDSREWLVHLYEPTRRALAESGWEAPDFDEFWRRGELALPSEADDGGFLRAFRDDPVKNKLPTPSGKIEIFSQTIAGFAYGDCPPHPTWLPSTEPATARHPLTLIANQPSTRLHSQLDFGAYSQSRKIAGREPVRLNPIDAERRGIAHGDIVRLFNDRGACLAAATLSKDVMPGVVQLSTGAWYDPEPGAAEQPLCVHGNPNVLTRDIGTSRLAQGCCGQVTVVECEKYVGSPPPIRAFDPPEPIEAAVR